MKEYIKKNITPLLIGLSTGIAFSMTLNAICDLITKIALIIAR